MVIQYPYDLFYKHEGKAEYDPITGDFKEQEKKWISVGKCRDEITPETEIIGNDGIAFKSSGVIYCPLGTREIPKGSTVKVVDGNSIRLLTSVKTFRKDQLHIRIWV